jgi:hypothetical protein
VDSQLRCGINFRRLGILQATLGRGLAGWVVSSRGEVDAGGGFRAAGPDAPLHPGGEDISSCSGGSDREGKVKTTNLALAVTSSSLRVK